MYIAKVKMSLVVFLLFFSFLSPFELSLTGAHSPTPCVDDVPIAGKKLTTSTHR